MLGHSVQSVHSAQPSHPVFVISPSGDPMVMLFDLWEYIKCGGTTVAVVGTADQLGVSREKVVTFTKTKFLVKTYGDVMVGGEPTYAMLLTKPLV